MTTRLRRSLTAAGVELVDHTGTIVARDGDRLGLGGGHPVDPDDRCMLGHESACIVGTVTMSD